MFEIVRYLLDFSGKTGFREYSDIMVRFQWTIITHGLVPVDAWQLQAAVRPGLNLLSLVGFVAHQETATL